ncbi:hypothetical protein K7640_19205 [Micromonospora sp. PLK6-60]|uniref:hypothetical protein n=1 Tax=Micromonospora sp. PLK6-60 TaxID=2873383 RepID=UPI001CA77D33|nr:hypothetical protein [Micromonospora sp. PLK6-60]MBY8873961.1 hypothetical protein [Micromonospora sp. PLK6-60]
MSRTILRLGTAALAAATGLAVAAAPAVAADPVANLTVSTNRLVLDPADRGYQGTLKITVANTGTAGAYPTVRITEPVAASLRLNGTGLSCNWNESTTSRQAMHCDDLQKLAPGRSRIYRIPFEVLTTVRDRAMSVDGGAVAVNTTGDYPLSADVPFATLFRASDGSLRNPEPYVQSTRPDASVSVGDAVLTQQEDGSWSGRLPVTVRYANDAPHRLIIGELSLPDGVRYRGTDPATGPSGGSDFDVPGGPFLAGEERTVDVLLSADADAGITPGEVGPVTVSLFIHWFPQVEDLNPADNVATGTISAS